MGPGWEIAARTFWVGLGGFLGANARYWIGGWVQQRLGTAFPWGTFVINVTGSFVLGLFMTLATDYLTFAGPRSRLFFAIGFVGAYTTFSTFEYETLNLLTTGSWARALGNAFGSLAAGLVAVWLGVAAARLLAEPGRMVRPAALSARPAAGPSREPKPRAAGNPAPAATPDSGRYPPFLPPRPAPVVGRVAEALGPCILRLVWRIRAVEIGPEELERLRSFRSLPALFVANHPSLAEPAVLFLVLRRAGVRAYLLTAWDTMFHLGWLSARVLQSLGAYSIRRGRPDRAAIDMTERLLAGGERVLAFPEGQTYGLNDVLLPFQEGVMLMGLRAAERRAREGRDTPLFVVPMAVKYLYLRPMAADVDASLRRLEAALGLDGGGPSRYARLRRVASAAIARIEREEGLPVGSEAELDARIERLRERLAARLAEALGVRLPAGADFPTVVQHLANAYDDFALRRARAPGGSPPLPESEVRRLYRTWLRMKHFVAVRDGYVAGWPSAERYLDLLALLEYDVLGRSRIAGPRKAVVRVGREIDLRAELAAGRDRRELLADLTARAEAEVRRLIDALARTAPPLDPVPPA